LGKSEVVVALISDISTVFGYPVPATVVSAAVQGLSRLHEKRRNTGREVLLAELRSGGYDEIEIASKDAVWETVDAYQRATMEGAARHSLKMLAIAMRKTVFSGHLTADQFLYLAPILAQLRLSEIEVLGVFLQAHERPQEMTVKEDERPTEWRFVKNILVPRPYANEEALEAACASLQRTGLVVGSSGWGSIVYGASPLLLEVKELIGLEAFRPDNS